VDVSEQHGGVKSDFTRSSILISLIFLFSVVVWAWMPPLWGSSEAREVQVVDRMLSTQELLLPLRNGIVPSKPPLFHWFAAGVSSVFGETSPYLVRVTSALFAFGTLLLLMTMTRRLALASEARFSSRASSIALMAGVICSTTYLFSSLAGNARVDMCFAFFVTASLWVIVRMVARSPLFLDRRASDVALFSLFTGFATLAKGPLGLVLPLLFLLSTTLFLGGVRVTLRVLRPQWGMMLYPLVILPWYGAAIMKAGWAFVHRQILFENIKRVTGDDHMNSEALWFYIPEFMRSLAPWSLLVLLALYVLFNTEFIKRTTIPEVDITLRKLLCLPVLWIAGGVILLSLASGKRPSYLLPLVPPCSIVGSTLVVLAYEAVSLRTRRTIGVSLIFLRRGAPYLLFLLMGGVEALRYLTLPPGAVSRSAIEWTVAYASPLQLSLLLGIVAIVSLRDSWAGSLMSFLVVFHFVFYYGAALKGHFKRFEFTGLRIKELVKGDEVLALKEPFDEYLDPVFYYLRREVVVRPPEEIRRGCLGWILARGSVIDRIARDGVQLSDLREFPETAPPEGKGRERTIVLARCENH